MKTTTVKRLECAWLLRDFAWALKRYADRIERCCTENPNDENERKALVWYARAEERWQKFKLSRREYITQPGAITKGKDMTPEINQWIDEFLRLAFKQMPSNPWRTGLPPDTRKRVKVFMGWLAHDNEGPRRMVECFAYEVVGCVAWRPA